MTDQPSAFSQSPTASSGPSGTPPRQPAPSGAALRGAVDLGTPVGAGSGAAPGGGGASAGGLIVEGSDATFEQIIARTVTVPAVLVVWSARQPQTKALAEVWAQVSRDLDGRFQIVTVDADTNPGLAQALKIEQVPSSVGLVQQQPVPLFMGELPADQVRAYADELVKIAVQLGVTGRVELDPTALAPQDELPALHQAAYEAIEAGDLPAARAAYEQALADNPKDQDATYGLAQIGLLERTADADLQQVRAAAAADPTNVDAALAVADADVLGGHVEDAFTRLIDLVRVTVGPERERVKARLIELFSVVGNHDERVRSARTALMSALF